MAIGDAVPALRRWLRYHGPLERWSVGRLRRAAVDGTDLEVESCCSGAMTTGFGSSSRQRSDQTLPRVAPSPSSRGRPPTPSGRGGRHLPIGRSSTAARFSGARCDPNWPSRGERRASTVAGTGDGRSDLERGAAESPSLGTPTSGLRRVWWRGRARRTVVRAAARRAWHGRVPGGLVRRWRR